MSDLKKIKLVKDYPIRHDIVVHQAAIISTGPYKAAQLIANEIAEAVDKDIPTKADAVKNIEKQVKKTPKKQ